MKKRVSKRNKTQNIDNEEYDFNFLRILDFIIDIPELDFYKLNIELKELDINFPELELPDINVDIPYLLENWDYSSELLDFDFIEEDIE